jgi:hypothetical protein
MKKFLLICYCRTLLFLLRRRIRIRPSVGQESDSNGNIQEIYIWDGLEFSDMYHAPTYAIRLLRMLVDLGHVSIPIKIRVPSQDKEQKLGDVISPYTKLLLEHEFHIHKKQNPLT